MNLIRSSLIAMLLAGLAVATIGCKEGDPISGGISPAIASFTAEEPPGGVISELVTLDQYSASGGRIVLDVVITEIDEPVTGVALKLTYPNAFSKFIACSDGDLFPPGTCYYDEPAEGSGEVFIGRSVSGGDQATTVVGSQVSVRIEFLVFGKGTGQIRFEAQNIGGSDASAVLDTNGDPIFVQWYSGVLEGS
jgi:hypothetical protein